MRSYQIVCAPVFPKIIYIFLDYFRLLNKIIVLSERQRSSFFKIIKHNVDDRVCSTLLAGQLLNVILQMYFLDTMLGHSFFSLGSGNA
jgi:hypothetical protein